MAVVDSGVTQSHWNEIDSRERPYLTLAHFFLTAGLPDRAAKLIDKDNRNVSSDFRARGQWLRRRDKAMLRTARGDRSAVDEIRLTIETDPSPMSAMADLLWANRKLGDRKAAEDAAKAYLAEMYMPRLEDDAFNLANVLRFLEEYATADGRPEDATRFRNRRAQLWRAADSELRRHLVGRRGFIETSRSSLRELRPDQVFGSSRNSGSAADGHCRRSHDRDLTFFTVRYAENVGVAHGERATCAYHSSARDQFFSCGGSHEIDFEFDREHARIGRHETERGVTARAVRY